MRQTQHKLHHRFTSSRDVFDVADGAALSLRMALEERVSCFMNIRFGDFACGSSTRLREKEIEKERERERQRRRRKRRRREGRGIEKQKCPDNVNVLGESFIRRRVTSAASDKLEFKGQAKYRDGDVRSMKGGSRFH